MIRKLKEHEGLVMIDIYTEKKILKDWILKNDLYFNLNTRI